MKIDPGPINPADATYPKLCELITGEIVDTANRYVGHKLQVSSFLKAVSVALGTLCLVWSDDDDDAAAMAGAVIDMFRQSVNDGDADALRKMVEADDATH